MTDHPTPLNALLAAVEPFTRLLSRVSDDASESAQLSGTEATVGAFRALREAAAAVRREMDTIGHLDQGNWTTEEGVRVGEYIQRARQRAAAEALAPLKAAWDKIGFIQDGLGQYDSIATQEAANDFCAFMAVCKEVFRKAGLP